MSTRYPNYDVLAKRHTPSWNETTRRVIDRRLAITREPRFLTVDEFRTLDAISARIVPQPTTRPPIPVAALIDAKLLADGGEGYRDHRLPPLREAWQRGLRALDVEARTARGGAFHTLSAAEQDALLHVAQDGALSNAAWQGMASKLFFAKRLLPDIVKAYYSHPTAWSEIGYGGPASPRGYVRLGFDARDPWEAEERDV
jgi:hypothetical protein